MVMDVLLKSLVDVLAGLGLPGVVICGLSWYLWYMVKKKDELQEARLQEYKLLVTALSENTYVMRSLKEVISYCERSDGPKV